jgi:hypothetical protein
MIENSSLGLTCESLSDISVLLKSRAVLYITVNYAFLRLRKVEGLSETRASSPLEK